MNKLSKTDGHQKSRRNRLSRLYRALHGSGFEYPPIAEKYKVPIVVTGFEPVDLLRGVLAAVKQLEAGKAEAENAYERAVTLEGNLPAQKVVNTVFQPVDRKWRGIGLIPQSGLGLRAEFAVLRCGNALLGGRDRHAGIAAVHRGRNFAGHEEAAAMFRVWKRMYAVNLRSARRWFRPKVRARRIIGITVKLKLILQNKNLNTKDTKYTKGKEPHRPILSFVSFEYSV